MFSAESGCVYGTKSIRFFVHGMMLSSSSFVSSLFYQYKHVLVYIVNYSIKVVEVCFRSFQAIIEHMLQ